MSKIYSYVIRIDSGSAPNPFWGVCTLTICKPVIRRVAKIGDWILGTGSKNTKLKDGKIHDFSGHIVYAMKITDKKTMYEYDYFCKENLINKIPNFRTNDWKIRLGDCIYDYSKLNPTIRRSVHNESHRKVDLGGENSLMSTHFYYFGSEPVKIPIELLELVKSGKGHKKIESSILIKEFEGWINQFDLNRLYADPQVLIGR